jgi:transcriptional regulator with XRE-family HTH domain
VTQEFTGFDAGDRTPSGRWLDRAATLDKIRLHADVRARAASRLSVRPAVPQSTWQEVRNVAAVEGDSFPELLRFRRQRSGLTQVQLAELSGLGVRTIRNWEQGWTLHPHRESVRRLAEGLGLTGEARETFERIAAGTQPMQPAAASEPPRQLPHDLADFTGRREQTAAMRAHLWPQEGRSVAPVVVISGPPGVGKTALAVHVSHQLREHFPDGQLFLDVQGARGAPLDPSTVLGAFLRAVDVPASAIPSELQERVALYRTRLADRRILLVLDNAIDEAQVRPLLPGGQGGAAVITSRSRLPGIEGIKAMSLGVLEVGESMELLARVAGAQRVAAEQEAAVAIIGLCGRLPLAVRIVAARLAARPHLQLARMADRLADAQRRLDLLDIGDLAVRSSFELSYKPLDAEAGTAFRLIAQLEVPDVSAWAIAALLGTTAERGEELAERLVDVHLLEPTPQGRYHIHDLLRMFARERLELEEPEEARAAALDRLLARSLLRLHHVRTLLGPVCTEPDHGTAYPVDDLSMAGDPPFATRQEAAAWLAAEGPTVVNAALQARGGHHPGSRVLAFVGEVYWRQRRFEEAITAFLQSLSVRHELADC